MIEGKNALLIPQNDNVLAKVSTSRGLREEIVPFPPALLPKAR